MSPHATNHWKSDYWSQNNHIKPGRNHPPIKNQLNPQSSLFDFCIHRLGAPPSTITPSIGTRLCTYLHHWVLISIWMAYSSFSHDAPIPASTGQNRCSSHQKEDSPDSPQSGILFLVFGGPQKDRGKCLIMDLRGLNKCIQMTKFHMVTLQYTLSLILLNVASIDLKDTYFHVTIRPQHCQFLQFAVAHSHYQYRVLPFVVLLVPLILIPTQLWA